MERPSSIRLRDPLTETTRKERRALLGASAVGIVIVKSGLVPSKINALGIEFTRTDQRALILAIGAIVTYFLVAFAIYAASDFTAWRVAFHNALEEWNREPNPAVGEETEEHRRGSQRARWWRIVGRPVSAVRATLEFLVPVVVGVYAMTVLFTAPLPRSP